MSSSSSNDQDKSELESIKQDFEAMEGIDTPESPPNFDQNSSGNDVAWQESSKTTKTSTTQANTGSRLNGETKPNFGAAGSCWSTKKYADEYERAESNLLDRTWNPTQYGDPLGRRD